jgi:hydrogenase maturation protein HypF
MATIVAMAQATRVRRRLVVRGIVQGVGFRPFVYGLAVRHQLAGFVGNDSQGVFIEVEGPPDAIDAFIGELRANPPPLASIESIASEALPPKGETAFVIVASAQQAGASTSISPDVAICADCLRELFDPSDRRYRYPFINCTNCGPRFTIIRDIPTTARRPRWRASPCARAVRRNITTQPIGAFTPSQMPARTVGRAFGLSAQASSRLG